LCLVIIVVGALTGTSIMRPFVELDANGDPVNPVGLMALLIVPFGVMLILVLAWVRFVERRPLVSIGLTGDHPLRAFVQGHATGVASILAIVVAIWLLGGFSAGSYALAWASPVALLSIAALLLCFALQASVEELLFRGWLLSVLSKKLDVPIGVVVSSALFALLHFSRGQPRLVTASNFLFGVFCCCWALRSRNVLGVMGWHSGWNWMLAVGFGLPVTGLDVGIPPLLVDLQPTAADWLTGGKQGPEGSITCVAYFVGSAAWMLHSARAASSERTSRV
jgi:membrane protease YdiL (CAAX protease family)